MLTKFPTFIVSIFESSKVSPMPTSFFFQAEDGIRYRDVTGVQTCALPISERPRAASGCLFHRVFQSIVNAMPSNSSASERADTKRGDRAAQVVVFAAARDLPSGVRITIDEASPEHAGFGSGTQLGLAVAAALARLHGARVATSDLAKAIGRGARSEIGRAH